MEGEGWLGKATSEWASHSFAETDGQEVLSGAPAVFTSTGQQPVCRKGRGKESASSGAEENFVGREEQCC